MNAPDSTTPPSNSNHDLRVAELEDSNSTDQSSDDQSIEQRIETTSQAASDALDQLGQATARPFQLDRLTQSAAPLPAQPIDVLGDVELDLRIELGRTQMSLQEVLQLRGGSVVALDDLVGDPVNVYANDRLIARGEIVVMNDNFCVRVTELVGS